MNTLNTPTDKMELIDHIKIIAEQQKMLLDSVLGFN